MSIGNDRYEYRTDGCLSQDPYCVNAPPPFGSYEAYRGEYCGPCDERYKCSRCGHGNGWELCNECRDEMDDDVAAQ